MRRLLVVAVLALTACTPGQLRAWVRWHAADPDAAIEYASQSDVVADLASGEHEAVADRGGATPGDCSSYASLFAAHGLPVATFTRIAWRESGCNHTRFTDDRDDLGGYLLGLNFRTATLRAGWLSWCGATLGNIRYDADRQVACAAAAYARLGLSPWS